MIWIYDQPIIVTQTQVKSIYDKNTKFRELEQLEALIIEKSEALRHIAQFLSPRISGAIYCSDTEKAEYEQERTKLSARIAEIEGILNEATKQEVVENAFSLYIGGQDITEGMADEQKEFIALLYDEISARVSEPFKAELQDKDDVIKMLKESVEEKDGTIAEIQRNEELAWKEADEATEKIIGLQNDKMNLEESLNASQSANVQLLMEREDALSKRDAAVEQYEESQKEIERLNNLVNEYQLAKVNGEVEAQKIITIEATERTERLQELAKKFIKGEQIGLYTEVMDSEGNKQVVHNRELEQMDIVDSFHIELPSIEGITGEVQERTGQDVEESNVVLTGIEDTTTGDPAEGASPAITEAEEAEKTASEEAFKAEYVTRGEYQELETLVHKINDLIYDRLGEHAA